MTELPCQRINLHDNWEITNADADHVISFHILVNIGDF